MCARKARISRKRLLTSSRSLATRSRGAELPMARLDVIYRRNRAPAAVPTSYMHSGLYKAARAPSLTVRAPMCLAAPWPRALRGPLACTIGVEAVTVARQASLPGRAARSTHLSGGQLDGQRGSGRAPRGGRRAAGGSSMSSASAPSWHLCVEREAHRSVGRGSGGPGGAAARGITRKSARFKGVQGRCREAGGAVGGWGRRPSVGAFSGAFQAHEGIA